LKITTVKCSKSYKATLTKTFNCSLRAQRVINKFEAKYDKRESQERDHRDTGEVVIAEFCIKIETLPELLQLVEKDDV